MDISEASGSQFIDDNHSKLLNILNKLGASLSEGWNMEAFSKGIFAFINTLEHHFQHEEVILKGIGFDGLATHIIKHREIASRLRSDALLVSNYDRAINFMGRIRIMVFAHEMFEDQLFWPLFEDEKEIVRPLIEWSEKLETGDEEIDIHHQALVNFINRLDKKIADSPRVQYVTTELGNLAVYSKSHFNEEEVVLGDNMNKGHINNHMVLLQDLNRLIEDIQSGELDIKSIGDYLKYWLINHIQTFDIPEFRQTP